MKNKHLTLLLLLVVQFINIFCFGQEKKTIAEQLGYPKNAKLLIVHADDLGVTHSENSSTISALEKGAINSAAIMVPCPWFPEIAAYARAHPEFDWGPSFNHYLRMEIF